VNIVGDILLKIAYTMLMLMIFLLSYVGFKESSKSLKSKKYIGKDKFMMNWLRLLCGFSIYGCGMIIIKFIIEIVLYLMKI